MKNKARLAHEFRDPISLTTKQLSVPEAMDTPPRPMTGFLASLSPEQQAAALSYCGPEDLGEPNSVLMDAK